MKKRRRAEPAEPEIAVEKKPIVLSEVQQERRGEKGIRCHACGCRRMEVDYTRPRNNFIQRRRVCANCGAVVRTREVPFTS